MTLICNIQAMHEIVYGYPIEFEELGNMTREQLEKMQDDLLPKYNKQISTKQETPWTN